MTTAVTVRHHEARLVRVAGVVQGVGFRPFVYHLARAAELTGWVRNDATGVLIHVEGTADRLDGFYEQLRAKAPAASAIDEVALEKTLVVGHRAFHILP